MTPLRRRMIEDMRIRNLSPHTQRAYVEQVSRFARHFGRPPELLGQDEIRSWQIYLVEERRLAASSISVAVAALRFVYAVTLKKPWIVEDDIPTSRQPKKLPVVPSPEEVARFLAAVGSPKHRMILTVCYATGLRISEAVSLKPAAIDSQRMVIRVEAQPDLTLEETVAVMRKRKIPGSRTALFRFLARHAVTLKKSPSRCRAAAGGCSSRPPALDTRAGLA